MITLYLFLVVAMMKIPCGRRRLVIVQLNESFISFLRSFESNMELRLPEIYCLLRAHGGSVAPFQRAVPNIKGLLYQFSEVNELRISSKPNRVSIVFSFFFAHDSCGRDSGVFITPPIQPGKYI